MTLIIDEFQKELTTLINQHSQDNGSDTPDFLLAEYLTNCLKNWNDIVCKRREWWGHREMTADGITKTGAPKEG